MSCTPALHLAYPFIFFFGTELFETAYLFGSINSYTRTLIRVCRVLTFALAFRANTFLFLHLITLYNNDKSPRQFSSSSFTHKGKWKLESLATPFIIFVSMVIPSSGLWFFLLNLLDDLVFLFFFILYTIVRFLTPIDLTHANNTALVNTNRCMSAK